MIGTIAAGLTLPEKAPTIGTIVVGLILLAVVAAIVVRGIHNKKRRKGGCSCGCSGCANNGVCHPKQS